MRHNFSLQNALCLIMIWICSLSSTAYDFYYNRIYYNDESNGSPYYDDWNVGVTYGPVKYKGDVVIPEIVSYTYGYYFVHAVDNDAFRDCIKLTRVIFNERIQEIRDNAFAGCTALKSVSLPTTLLGNGAFKGCTHLEQLELGTSLVSMGSEAFRECAITNLNIPRTMVSIGEQAFSYCDQLRRINIPGGEVALKMGKQAFKGSSQIDTIQFMGLTPPVIEDDSCFDESVYAHAIVLVPASLVDYFKSDDYWSRFEHIESLGYDAHLNGSYYLFDDEHTATIIGCDNVTDADGAMTIPSTITYLKRQYTVTSIKQGAFRSHSEIKRIRIPSTISEISADAFRDCTSLKYSGLPSSVKKVGRCAFAGCTSLFDMSNGDSVVEVCDSAFAGCSSLSNCGFGKAIRRVGDYAYDGCVRLNYVLFDSPDLLALEEIGECAFRGCRSISGIWIPSKLHSIGDEAFKDCTGLLSIIFSHDNMNLTIGKSAFSGCTSLQKIVSQVMTPPLLSENNSFDESHYSNTEIHMPHSTVSSYRNSPVWGHFAKFSPMIADFISDGIFYALNGEGTVSVTHSDYELGDIVTPHVISIPSTVTHSGVTYRVTAINAEAYWFSYVRKVIIPNSIKQIPYRAFSDSDLSEVELGDSIESIGAGAFLNTHLCKFKLPRSVKQLGNQALGGCGDLTSLSVEEGNPVFDSRENCNAIIRTDNNELKVGCKTTVIPSDVVSIGDSAFMNIPITTIDIPSSVTHIGVLAFAVSGLTRVVVPGSLTEISPTSFMGAINLEEVEIQNGVQTIGEAAFSLCQELKSLSLPNTLKSIGSGAFSHCSALEKVLIPNSVTTIGPMAFMWCNSLDKLTLGSGLVSIGDWAFDSPYPRTHSIGFINCLAPNPPTMLADDCFQSSYLNAILCVPPQSLELYKRDTNWSRFFHIQSIDNSEVSSITVQESISKQRYNLLGQPVDDDYKGIVIENGQKRIVN